MNYITGSGIRISISQARRANVVHTGYGSFPSSQGLVKNDLDANLTKQMCEWTGVDFCAFELLYKATVDGWSGVAFHNRCDHKV